MSVAASQYERVANEKYYTPAWVTQALFSVERSCRRGRGDHQRRTGGDGSESDRHRTG